MQDDPGKKSENAAHRIEKGAVLRPQSQENNIEEKKTLSKTYPKGVKKEENEKTKTKHTLL